MKFIFRELNIFDPPYTDLQLFRTPVKKYLDDRWQYYSNEIDIKEAKEKHLEAIIQAILYNQEEIPEGIVSSGYRPYSFEGYYHKYFSQIEEGDTFRIVHAPNCLFHYEDKSNVIVSLINWGLVYQSKSIEDYLGTNIGK